MQQQAMIWTICSTAGMTHRQAGRGQRQISKLQVLLLESGPLAVLTPQYSEKARPHAEPILMQFE